MIMKDFLDKLKQSTPVPELLVKYKLRLAVASFIAGVFFGLLGMLIIPYGVIDATVLVMVAQLLVLCATLLGRNITIDLEHKYFNTDSNYSRDPEDKKENT